MKEVHQAVQTLEMFNRIVEKDMLKVTIIVTIQVQVQ